MSVKTQAPSTVNEEPQKTLRGVQRYVPRHVFVEDNNRLRQEIAGLREEIANLHGQRTNEELRARLEYVTGQLMKLRAQLGK